MHTHSRTHTQPCTHRKWVTHLCKPACTVSPSTVTKEQQVHTHSAPYREKMKKWSCIVEQPL